LEEATMELPFAVHDDSPLVTASSRGTLGEKEGAGRIGRSNYAYTETNISSNHHGANQNRASDDEQLSEVLSQYGVSASQMEADFTYVNVCETGEDEVEVILDKADSGEQRSSMKEHQRQRGDVLALLLTGTLKGDDDTLLQLIDDANRAVSLAADAKQEGNLQKALDAHTLAANFFRNAATTVPDGTYIAAYVDAFFLT
jgi:hypothetical protein